MRVVSLDRPSKSHQPLKVFDFLILVLNIVLKPRPFPPNRIPKMRESQQLLFRLRLVSEEFQHPAIQTKIVQSFGRFFHHITGRQPIGRRGIKYKP
jgi:hypothetical protein